MKKYLRNWFRKTLYLYVFIGFNFCFAGSYENFFVAIKNDAPGVVAELLARGFDANTPNPQGLTGLYLALVEPAPKVLQVLMSWPQTNLEAANAQGETVLMLAALKGQLQLVNQLIEKGAEVNKQGWTALHYAASGGGHVDVMRALLENHAYIDAESPNGTTPLMMAAQYGSPDVVKLLLEEGADPTLKNQQGLSAVDFAQRVKRTTESMNLIATFTRAHPTAPVPQVETGTAASPRTPRSPS